MKRAAAIFLFWLIGAGAAGAQVQFSAELDRTRLYVGERTVLTVRVQGNGIDASSLHLPDLAPYFQVLRQSTPQRSSQITIVNGRMQSSESLTMVIQLEALKAGRAEIPALVIYAGANLFQTDPIAVEIQEPPPASAGEEREGWAPAEDPYLEAKVDRSEVFVGEQVVVTWTIYYRRDIYNLSWGNPPSYRGFAAQDLDQARRLDQKMENYGGALYHVSFLKSTAFFPLQSGDMTIPPLEIQYESASGRRDFWGQLLTEGRTVSSRPIALKVLPLPEEGKPGGFSGAVGQFTIASRLEKTEVPAHDSARLIFTVTGDGYADFVTEPVLPLPASFEVYPPEVNRTAGNVAGRFQTRKEFSCLMVPREAGRFVIPPARFDYFDPASRTYRSAQSPSYTLTVTPARPAAAAAGPSLRGDLTREEVKLLSEDIRYLKPDQTVLPRERRLHRSPAFLLLQILPALLPALALVWRRRQERLSTDLSYARMRRAFSQSKKRLKQAQRLQKAGEATPFYAELSRALTQYFADRFNLAAAGLTSERIEEVFREKSVEDSIRLKFLDLLGVCDRARFGAAPTEASASAEALRRAGEVIAALEKSRP